MIMTEPFHKLLLTYGTSSIQGDKKKTLLIISKLFSYHGKVYFILMCQVQQ